MDINNTDDIPNNSFFSAVVPSVGKAIFYKTEHCLFSVFPKHRAWCRAPFRNDDVDSFSHILISEYEPLDNPFGK